MGHEHGVSLIKGAGGIAAVVLGLVSSWQAELEWFLRVISLLVGIGVGLATIWSIMRGRRSRD